MTTGKSDLELKELGALEIKDAEKGEVEAVIATLGVVDRDYDVISPDAIKDGAKVKMSAYGHDLMFGGEMPVGRGSLHVEGDKAVFKGKLFLSTQRGREAFDVLKEMGKDQEWSFGFRVLGSEVPDDAWREKGARRILTKLDAFEVSPVLIGAGVGTRTLAVKEADEAAQKAADEARRVQEETAAREAEATAAAELEEKARQAADFKARATAAVADYQRVQRTLKRLGVA